MKCKSHTPDEILPKLRTAEQLLNQVLPRWPGFTGLGPLLFLEVRT